MNSTKCGKELEYSFRVDLRLASLYIASLSVVIASFDNEIIRFYAYLIAVLVISIGIARRCKNKGTSPVANSYLSLAVAAIGLCLLVYVTEGEKKKVQLLHLYEPTIRQFQAAKRDLHLFNIATENRGSIRQQILERNRTLPSEYTVTDYNCITMPQTDLISGDLYDINNIGTRTDVPMLNDFVDDTHCTETVITVEREKLNESMSLREMIQKNRYGSYELAGRRYSLSSLLPYAGLTLNSDESNKVSYRLEATLEDAEQKVKRLEAQYQKIGSEIATDIQGGGWKTKSFYLSWWNFFLIIALGYQLNSVIINRS